MYVKVLIKPVCLTSMADNLIDCLVCCIGRLVPCERTEEKLTLSVPTVTLNPKNGVWLKAEIREPKVG